MFDTIESVRLHYLRDEETNGTDLGNYMFLPVFITFYLKTCFYQFPRVLDQCFLCGILAKLRTFLPNYVHFWIKILQKSVKNMEKEV